MKKQYNVPKANLVKVNSQDIIQTSGPLQIFNFGFSGNGVSLGKIKRSQIIAEED